MSENLIFIEKSIVKEQLQSIYNRFTVACGKINQESISKEEYEYARGVIGELYSQIIFLESHFFKGEAGIHEIFTDEELEYFTKMPFTEKYRLTLIDCTKGGPIK